MKKLLLSVAIVTMVAIVAGPATAGGKGKGPTRGSGTLSLVLMDGATEAHHNGRITFDVSATTDRPFVGVRCWQGSDFVYDGYVGYFPEYMFDPWFTLGSPYWRDGETASCTARLFYFNKRGGENVLATMSFPVAP